MPQTTLNELSPHYRRLLGLALFGLGLLCGWLIYTNPEAVRAPLWFAYTSAACFVATGVAVFLHASVSRRVYAWLMVGLLSLMSVIPAWMALGPGRRECTSQFLPLSEFGCRISFGLGAVLMGGTVTLAVYQARKQMI